MEYYTALKINLTIYINMGEYCKHVEWVNCGRKIQYDTIFMKLKIKNWEYTLEICTQIAEPHAREKSRSNKHDN